jgi:hypothetical protein
MRIGLFFSQGELIMPDKEQPKGKMDIFEIGIYAIEIVVIAAIVYAIIAFPGWLKPATS